MLHFEFARTTILFRAAQVPYMYSGVARGGGGGGGGAGGDICPRAQGVRGAKIAQLIIALTRTGPRAPLESC